MKKNAKLREFFVIVKEDENAHNASGWKRFVGFLDIMKDSLKCLEIKVTDIDASIFVKIINDMKLTRFFIDSQEFPTNLKTQSKNHYLKTLVVNKLQDLFGNLLLSAFPNIQYLPIKSFIPKNISELFMPTLSLLSVNTGTLTIDATCSFINVNPSIETLSIDCCYPLNTAINHQILDRITKNSMNLKKLIIKQGEFVINMESASNVINKLSRS